MSSRWIKYKDVREGADINLICLPHAGGSAAFFKEWGDSFSDNINILPVQMPGRENRIRESMPDSIQELAEIFVRENSELFSKGFALFGHSLGSVIGLEVAYAAKEICKREPQGLFVSGTQSPFNKKRSSLGITDKEISDSLVYLEGTTNSLLKSSMFMEYFMPIIKRDLNLYQNYEWNHTDILDCPMYAFGGNRDTHTSIGELGTWRQNSRGYLGESVFEGGHFYLTEHKSEIAEIIEKVIFRKERVA